MDYFTPNKWGIRMGKINELILTYVTDTSYFDSNSKVYQSIHKSFGEPAHKGNEIAITGFFEYNENIYVLIKKVGSTKPTICKLDMSKNLKGVSYLNILEMLKMKSIQVDPKKYIK